MTQYNTVGNLAEGNVRPERRLDFDWLRAIAILLVAGCHAVLVLVGFIFGARGDCALFGYYLQLTIPWLMPVLFLLSGASTHYALQTRPPREYVKERCRRLLVPLVFGTLVIIPPQMYCERLYKGQFSGSYLAFYPHFFEGFWPNGNFGCANLWFIGYLVIISLMGLPLCLRLDRPRGRRLVAKLAAVCEHRGAIFLFAVPLAATQFLLVPMFPWTWNPPIDWAMITWYLYMYLAGYVVSGDVRFWRAIERHWLPALIGGVALLYFGYPGMQFITPSGYSLDSVSPILLSTCITWCFTLAALGFSARFLRFGGPLLSYVRDASYPFYIMHQTVVVIFAYYVLRWDVPTLAKFFAVLIPAVLGTLLLYDLAVRRWRVARFLFGMNRTIL